MKIVVPSTQSIVGAAVHDAAEAPQRILEEVMAHLSQGDGWISDDDDGVAWHFGRLSAHLKLVPRNETHLLRCDIPLVTGVKEISPELLVRLNEMNAHAYGWLFWFNPSERSIISTYTGIASRNDWWWTWFALETIPIQATVSESAADELARISGGSVAIAPHPTRGPRQSLDGWITTVRHGNREPVASMGHFITLLDAILVKEAYGVVRPPAEIEIWDDFSAYELDGDGWITVRAASHFHPEYGWCWQHAKMAGFTDNSAAMADESLETASQDPVLLQIAAEMNAESGLNTELSPIIGGWVVADWIGLAHVSHLNGAAIEYIAADAKTGFGTSMGIILGQLTLSSYDLDDTTFIAESQDDHNLKVTEVLSSLQTRTGPVGFSYRAPASSQPSPDFEAAPDSPDNWLLPKHLVLANFGIFNPAGPTVGSLEVGFRGDQQILFLVLRHPFSPACTPLASADLNLGSSAFPQDVKDWFSGHSWSPLDWVTVFDDSITDAVNEGLIEFAETLHRDVLNAKITLLTRERDPWMRVSTKREIEYNLADAPTLEWRRLVTEESNGWQYKAFIKSAWEGSRIFGTGGDANTAQNVADYFRSSVIDRCMNDFEQARRGEGPPLQPLGIWSH